MIIYNYIDMYHTISNMKHNILCHIMNASLEDRLKINCITCYISKTLKTMQRAHIHTLKLKQFEWLPCTSKWWAEVHLVQIPLIREMIHCNSPCHMLAYTLNRRMILHSFFDSSFWKIPFLPYFTIEIIHESLFTWNLISRKTKLAAHPI